MSRRGVFEEPVSESFRNRVDKAVRAGLEKNREISEELESPRRRWIWISGLGISMATAILAVIGVRPNRENFDQKVALADEDLLENLELLENFEVLEDFDLYNEMEDLEDA